MTPFEIRILLHFYACTDDPEACVNNVPIWRPTIDKFLAEKLVTVTKRQNRTYELTDRGECYVNALQAMPLPQPRWVVASMDYEPGPDG